MNDRSRILILANPLAGAGRSAMLLESLVGALRTRGFEPEVCWQREKLTAQLDMLDRNSIRCVVAAGGDGTFAEVLNRAQGLPLAVFPVGTENLVAQHCRIERSGERLAEIIAAGTTATLDAASANGRLFCLMASAGFDAAVVHRVHRRRQGPISRWHYLLPILRCALSYRFPLIDVEIEETGERLQGALVQVFNMPRYGAGLAIAPGAGPMDGLLDLCVFDRSGLFNLARYAAAVVRGRQTTLADYHHRLVRSVRLKAAIHVPLQMDGDPAGQLPARIEVVPGAIQIMGSPAVTECPHAPAPASCEKAGR